MNHLLLVDGSSLLSEMYHGTLPHEMKKERDKEKQKEYYHLLLQAKECGLYTNAVYGFMKKLEKILEEQKPTHLAVTFDITRNTFRQKLYPEYKAQRSSAPEPLEQQKKTIIRLLTDIGIKTYYSMELEGDDIIGILAERFKKEALVTIMSADQDFTQLAGENVRLWLTQKDANLAEMRYLEYTGGEGLPYTSLNIPAKVLPLTADLVKEHMGVMPHLVPALKALGGDSSDNYPGIKGVSTETAAVLLNYYGDLNILMTDVRLKTKEELTKEWKELGLKRPPVKAFKEMDEELVYTFLNIATIRTDIKTSFNICLKDLEVHINQTMRKNWYDMLEFHF